MKKKKAEATASKKPVKVALHKILPKLHKPITEVVVAILAPVLPRLLCPKCRSASLSMSDAGSRSIVIRCNQCGHTPAHMA
jgi:hypothetical protein